MQNSFLKTFSAIALITLLMLGAIELISIVLLNEKYNRSFDRSIIITEKFFDSDGLKPNAGATVWGKKFSTDKFGFRNSGKTFDKKKKTRLFIGDSVTQGVGVDDSCCFVSLIAAKTDSLNVLNCSMIGWSIHDYKNVIRHLLSDSSDSLNLSQITLGWCLNDIYGNVRSTDLPAMGNQGWKRLLSDFLHQHYSTFRLIKLLATQNSDSYYRFDKQFYSDDSQQLKNARRDILEIIALAESKNIAINFVIFPYRSQIERSIPSPAAAVFPTEICVTDLTQHLTLSTIPTQSLFLFSDEIHFSSLGHHIIASALTSKDFRQNKNCFYD